MSTLADYYRIPLGLAETDGPTFAHLHLTDLAAITTIAESWIGPSSTTGIYFKGGFCGFGTTTPDVLLTLKTPTGSPVKTPALRIYDAAGARYTDLYHYTDDDFNIVTSAGNIALNAATGAVVNTGTGDTQGFAGYRFKGVNSNSYIDFYRGGDNQGIRFFQGISLATAGATVYMFDNNASGKLSAASGNQNWMSLEPTIAQSSTAGYTALNINATQTSVGSGSKYLINAQVGSVSKFSVSNTGAVVLAAGSAVASTAPLKFTSGPVLSSVTSEAGAVEFLTDDLSLIITTGPARKGFVLNDGANLTSTKVPVASTNGRLIDSSMYSDGADNWWVGDGTGLAYGSIYGHNVAVDIVMAAQDTEYQVLAFDTAGQSNMTTCSAANDDITVLKTGVYYISYHASVHSHAANDFSVSVKKNNGATGFDNIDVHFDSNVADKLVAVSGCGFASLAANDTIELWAHRNDGGAVSKTLTFDHTTLTVLMVGG